MPPSNEAFTIHLFMNSPLTSLLLMSLIFCSALARGVGGQTLDQDDVIRVETDLTNLFFTASAKNARFITILREEDFRVTEDGVAQKILTFQRETDRPLALAFLIDVSASQERTLSQEKAAARGFIETIIRSNKDHVAIIPFTGSAFLEQGLTRDVFSVYRALESVEVAKPSYLGSGRPISGITSGPGMPAPPREGSTAIWEAVTLTAREILAPAQDPSQVQRRRYRNPVGTRRLKHDQRRPQFPQPFPEFLDAFPLVGRLPLLAGRAHSDIEDRL